jgi:hypothetical protein
MARSTPKLMNACAALLSMSSTTSSTTSHKALPLFFVFKHINHFDVKLFSFHHCSSSSVLQLFIKYFNSLRNVNKQSRFVVAKLMLHTVQDFVRLEQQLVRISARCGSRKLFVIPALLKLLVK